MQNYVEELEKLIADTLLPTYLEHYRLLGRPSPVLHINKRLLEAAKHKPKIAKLLQKDKYG